jgi:hypothetical protein
MTVSCYSTVPGFRLGGGDVFKVQTQYFVTEISLEQRRSSYGRCYNNKKITGGSGFRQNRRMTVPDIVYGFQVHIMLAPHRVLGKT